MKWNTHNMYPIHANCINSESRNMQTNAYYGKRITNYDKTARRQLSMQRQTMRRHGNRLGGRSLGEKRRKRWKRCKEWRCEKRQWAFYKERTSRRSASLASPSAPSAPSAPHARRTHDDGFLPSGLRPIDTLLLLPGFKSKFKFKCLYIYNVSLRSTCSTTAAVLCQSIDREAYLAPAPTLLCK